jgi:hypothetical protein
MSTRDNAPPPEGWRPEPHPDPFGEMYVWLDALSIEERRTMSASGCDLSIPPNVILGGAGE